MTPVDISQLENAPAAAQTMSRRRAVCLLILISLALFLPGFVTLQPMDRDEPRFAQATKQMLESGDYVAIRFQDEARNKKPVGIYWMQAGVVALAEKLGVPDARTQIYLYRAPSLAGAVATVLLTFWAALALVGERAAFIAALMLASCILLGVEARLGKTDAVVAATVAACMGVLARCFIARQRPDAAAASGWRLAAIFWTAIGLGLLVKGPITPMVPAFAAIGLSVWTRSAAWLRPLRPLAGIAWSLAIVAPWFILIMIETKGAFLADSVGQDMLGKVAAGQEAHGAPPGAYLVAFLGVAWPFAPIAALAAPFAWRNRREPAVAFLLAWLVPAWIVFEAAPTKLPHYVLPLYPALAILAALALQRGAVASGRAWRALLWLIPAVPVILAVAGAAAAVWFGAPPGWLYFAAAPLVLWQAWRVAAALRAGTIDTLPMSAALLAFLTYLMVYGGILTGPVFAPLAMSPRLVAAQKAALGETSGCQRLAPASTGFREPSLVFLAGTDIEMTTAAGAADFLAGGPCRVAFVEAREEAAFQARLGERGDVRVASRVAGLNLNGGRRLDIALYVRQGGP